MRITVSVKPNSKTSKVEKIDVNCLKVRVDAPAEDGKANMRLIVLLAEYFEVPKSSVRIVRGMTSKEKTVEVNK